MKKIVKKYKEGIIIAGISLVAFIVGYFSVGLLKSFLIIGLADAIYIGSVVLGSKKKTKKSTKTPTPKAIKKKKKKFFKILAIIFIIGCIGAMVGGSAFIFMIVKNAPEFNPNNLYTQESSTLYDINGDVIAKLGSEKREKVTYDQLSQVLIDAIVATEDSNFFSHNGFDLSRFLVASVKQVLTSGGGGASTLTMQISKNSFTDTSTSITRKFTDIYLSIFEIEKEYTKEEIMEFYVNAPYLGSGAWGVEQACQTYFGKSAADINLSEAALIAGLFQLPSTYDPNVNPDYAESRRQTVLYLMHRHGYITDEEYEVALKMTVETLLYTGETASSSRTDYQVFIDTVAAEVETDTGYNPYVVPMEVYTTMDPDKQTTVSAIMRGDTYTWENDAVDAGISIVDVNTGAIAAVGGGRNRVGELQYNTATMISRQIGSTAKPIYDYAPGIEFLNWSTYTPFTDEEYSYSNGVSISNWDRKFNGFLTLRSAMAQSRNIPALKAFKSVKNSDILSFVTSLGLSPEVSDGIVHEAHAIGGYNGESPLTMSTAYAAFGNGGYYITPHSYTKVVYKNTNEVYEKVIEKTRVMSEETAYMMTSLLQSSATSGLGAQSYVNGAVYGAKTGTSNYDQATIEKWGFGVNAVNDLWINAVSPDYAISIWYGYKTINAEYTSNSYTISHRKLFQTLAKGVFKTTSNWTQPESVLSVKVELGTDPAALPSAYTPSDLIVTELFKEGTEPTEESDRYSKLDDVTNLKGTLTNTTLTLSWNTIGTPNAISDTWLNTYFTNEYTSSTHRASALASRLSYNSSTIGTIVYKVYSKNTAGELTYIGTTAKNTYDITVTSTSTTTYVVKTSYTIFTANMSDGASVKVTLGNVTTGLVATLIGDKSVNVALNATYASTNYNAASIKVTYDDVTVLASDTNLKVVVAIKNASNETVTTIDTTKASTYTVTYTVTYNTKTTTLTRTIIVK